MQAQVKERPILFNADMVRAILEGRKTVTRRLVPDWQLPKEVSAGADGNLRWASIAQRHPKFGFAVYGSTEAECMANYGDEYEVLCPFGKPGDRLWVRETFRYGTGNDCMGCEVGCGKCPASGRPMYAADFAGEESEWGPWKPSIHMPRSACRILLEITSVRAERIQDITKADAEAEGFKLPPTEAQGDWAIGARTNFRKAWEQLYGDSWDSNDWVWVIEFERVPVVGGDL